MFHTAKRPAKEITRKNAACSKSAKSARAISLSLSVVVLLSACGDWNTPYSDSASANQNANPESEMVVVQVVDPDTGAVEYQSVPAASGSNLRTTSFSDTDYQTQTAFTGSCSAESPPAGIQTLVVGPNDPVDVPKHFMGMHLGLHIPSWKAGAFSPIPAPTYDYGYSRTLKVEVDGLEERGFWSNIEIAPGVYDWQYMDKWMQANAGHPVVWLISGTPSFYQKYPGEPTRWPSWPGIASPPTNAGHQALKAYAQAAKARYGDQIAAFEIANEPTLPWTGGRTSYNDRWTPEWGRANLPGNPAPFFSGSASDLANIAYTLNTANLGVPVLGAAFVDQWREGSTTVDRFLNAPITLPGGWGTGKDHIQGLSTHFYDYHFKPTDMLQVIDGYRAKLAAAGIPDMPIWGTETGGEVTGKFQPFDARAPINIQRWVLLAAAKRTESLILYGHVAEDDLTDNLSNPVDNPAVIQSLQESYEIGGQRICNAAVLTDGRVWVTTASGRTWLK